MKIKKLLIFFFIIIFSLTLYSENKKLCAVKKSENYVMVFYPVLIDGIIRQMEYLYKYEIKFDLNINKPISIYKIEAYLPSNTQLKNTFDRKIFLQKGKYSFTLPVIMKDNITINNFTIRFYFKPQIEIQNQPQTQNHQTGSNQNQQSQNNLPEPEYTEYIINTADFTEADINSFMN